MVGQSFNCENEDSEFDGLGGAGCARGMAVATGCWAGSKGGVIMRPTSTFGIDSSSVTPCVILAPPLLSVLVVLTVLIVFADSTLATDPLVAASSVAGTIVVLMLSM